MALPKCKCIYEIINIKTNKRYIGSTNNFKKKVGEHLSKLKNNYHRNKELQKDYNKFGKDIFIFDIIKKIEKQCLLNKLEDKIIKRTEDVYNTRKAYTEEVMGTKMFHITNAQRDLLKTASNKTGKSEAQIIREAIDKYLKG